MSGRDEAVAGHHPAGDADRHPGDRQPGDRDVQGDLAGQRPRRGRAAAERAADLRPHLPDHPAADRGLPLVPADDPGAELPAVADREEVLPLKSRVAAGPAADPRTRPGPEAGDQPTRECATRERRRTPIVRPQPPQELRTTGWCWTSTWTSRAARSSASSGPAGRASRRCCAASTGWRRSTAGVLRVNGEDFGFRERPDAYQALTPQGARRATDPDRHGLPAVQPVPEHDRPRERHVRAGAGARAAARAQAGERARELLASVGLEGHGDHYPCAAVRWSAATRGHRSSPGDGPPGDAVRRADQRTGPGAGRARCSRS